MAAGQFEEAARKLTASTAGAERASTAPSALVADEPNLQLSVWHRRPALACQAQGSHRACAHAVRGLLTADTGYRERSE